MVETVHTLVGETAGSGKGTDRQIAQEVTLLVNDFLVGKRKRIEFRDQFGQAVSHELPVAKVEMHVGDAVHVVSAEGIEEIGERDVAFADANGVNSPLIQVFLKERRVDTTDDRKGAGFFLEVLVDLQERMGIGRHDGIGQNVSFEGLDPGYRIPRRTVVFDEDDIVAGALGGGRHDGKGKGVNDAYSVSY